jgi:hypothetical protein
MADEFIKSLSKFHQQKGETLKIPQIGGRELDIYLLYKEVTERGGFQQVSNNKLWKEIVSALKIPSSCTSASYTLRNHYQRLLFQYEQQNFFGKTVQPQVPTALEPASSKCSRRIRLSPPMISDTRRMILAFESQHLNEVCWALNTLLLFSCNTVHSYTLEPNGLLEYFVKYMQMLCKKIWHEEPLSKKRMRDASRFEEITEESAMEQLKTIALILRNLSMHRSNEIPMFKNAELFEMITRLFTSLLDREITSNMLDVVSNLAKHIFLKDISNWKELLSTLMDCLQSSLAEQTIECFRKLSLPLGNEEMLEFLPDEFYEELAKWLSSPSSAREAVLEILCTMSDQSLSTRVKITKAPKCLEGLVALLSSVSLSEEGDDKQAKMSALILSNLTAAPSTCHLFQPFERQILMVAAADERMSGFLCCVLHEINDIKLLITKV